MIDQRTTSEIDINRVLSELTANGEAYADLDPRDQVLAAILKFHPEQEAV